jgi:predicted glutamine amidotransferase
MCGLVGVLGYLETKDETLIRRLLLFDYFRGTDSTGMAAVSRNGEDSEVVKLPSHPLDLFDMAKFKAMTKSAYMSSAYIGHNRSATVGKVTSSNAHPFKVGAITGAHNGTLSAACFLELKKLIGLEVGTDSEAIFTAIDMFGIEAVVPVLQGAWALVWHDANDGTINFLKNKERPLWFAWSKKQDRLIWASEYPTIRAAVATGFTTEYELFEDPKKGYNFWSFEDDIHYTIALDQFTATMTDKPKITQKNRKGKEPAPVVTHYSGNQNFTMGAGYTPPTATNNSSTTSSPGGDTFEFWDSDTKPFGDIVTLAKFSAIVSYGCHWCGAEIDSRDKGITLFPSEELCLCSACSGNKIGDPKTRIYVDSLPAAKSKCIAA